jgi:hypothetical protein
MPEDHPEAASTERLAQAFRDPGEARPDLSSIRALRLPAAVVSGGHQEGLERTCDALADRLGAERWVERGAGHAVQRTDGFDRRLRAFVAKAEAQTRGTEGTA